MRDRAAVARVLAIAALAAVVALIALWQRAEQRSREVESWTRHVLDSLATTVDFPNVPNGLTQSDSLYWVWAATIAKVQSRGWQAGLIHARKEMQPGLGLYRIEELRRLGLPDPANNLRDSLVAHPELIPYPGVLGGKMGFSEEAIIFLPESEQVWAYFEDGHVGGTMLLEYFVEPGGVVHWKPLWSRRE